MGSQNKKTRNAYNEGVSDMLALVEKRKKKLEEVVGKRRFEKFWAENQTLKSNLESEKKTLTEQIEALKKEISATPAKTEGYNEMLELKKRKPKTLWQKKRLLAFLN